VPLFYTLLDDVKRMLVGMLRRGLGAR